MTLDRSDFAAFFGELHEGYRPFAWQERLLDAVLGKREWPARIVAPTGAGKTAVIDVHVFAQALAVARGEPAPPRRLAMVVGRRVLVDDQFRHARLLARRLAEGASPVLAAMRDLLWAIRSPDPDRRATERTQDAVSPLVVARMRGGAPPSRTWLDHPTAAAVICATPDMWGSRLLFRGYGSSPQAWPREAGLLAVDSVLVVDEAHLARQLLVTAQRVGQLVPVSERGMHLLPLQVVETTATPAGDGTGVGVDADDLVDEVLAARLRSPKPVRLLPVKDWMSPRSLKHVATAMADEVAALLAVAGTTVGCFVNTVARAVAVAQELRERSVGGRPLRVVMICGQVRPVDVERLETEHPGLLSAAGNDGVDVLVSTQSLEVGVDLDLTGMVTELASGSALAQRVGRVNRRGLRPTGPVVVVVPDEIVDRTQSGPYAAPELRDAVEWLAPLTITGSGLAPWALREHAPPPAPTRRTLLQRPELGHAWHWARTSEDLVAEPELELWLSDDFTDDTSVGLLVRDNLPVDSSDACRLVEDLPPRRHEIFSLPYGSARRALMDHGRASTAVVVRGGDVEPLEWREGTPDTPRIRPGDLVVLNSTAKLFTASAAGFSPPVVVDDPDECAAAADDVLEARPDPAAGEVVHRIESPDLLSALLDEQEPDTEREAVRGWLADRPGATPMAAAALELLSRDAVLSEVVIHRDADGNPVRVLIVDRRRAAADEGIRQVWTPSGKDVTLAQHQRDVAARAEVLARTLGLDAQIVGSLTLAGAHHDGGKRDLRFQSWLGARPDTILAKSRAGTTRELSRRRRRLSGVPVGWRHEQRSVVECWDFVATSADPQLVARLVGTSHGHGRSDFPHTADDLLPEADESAREMFDLGGWDDLMERTQRRYGVWGCAYLEALLRAADGQISEEGR